MIAYPVFLLVLTVPALAWLFGTGDGRTGAGPLSGPAVRQAVLTVMLTMTAVQAAQFFWLFFRYGPDRGEYFDAGPAELRSLTPEEQIIAIHGRGELRCRRLNYLTDRRFAGMFDKNSFYANRPLPQPPSR